MQIKSLSPFVYFLLLGFIILLAFSACNQKNEISETKAIIKKEESKIYPFSLAQWSYHKMLSDGQITTEDFMRKAADQKYSGVEFVSKFFKDKIDDEGYFKSLEKLSQELGVINVLLMVDEEKELGDQNEENRLEAVETHKKWINASALMGCSAMRINAHGNGTAEEMAIQCKKSIAELAKYGINKGVQIYIENHGSYSSDGKWLVALLEDLKKYEVGCLLDFNNWCIERENGKLWGADCINTYPRYQGMKELIPYAKGISVKSFSFNDEGEETTMDYKQMADIIKASGFDGYLGVEFEGEDMDIKKGTDMTRDLLDKYIHAAPKQ